MPDPASLPAQDAGWGTSPYGPLIVQLGDPHGNLHSGNSDASDLDPNDQQAIYDRFSDIDPVATQAQFDDFSDIDHAATQAQYDRFSDLVHPAEQVAQAPASSASGATQSAVNPPQELPAPASRPMVGADGPPSSPTPQAGGQHPDEVARTAAGISATYKPSVAQAAGRGFASELTMGAEPYLHAAAKASGAPIFGWLASPIGAARLEAEKLWPSTFGHSATDRYNRDLQLGQAKDAVASDQQPLGYRLGEAGGFATGFVAPMAAPKLVAAAPRVARFVAEEAPRLIDGIANFFRSDETAEQATRLAKPILRESEPVLEGGTGGARPASTPENVTPKGAAYALRDPETGKVMRSGRTGNAVQRESQHARDPTLKRFIFDPIFPTDDYAEQRGLEQYLHDLHDPPYNYIRPISPRNARRSEYLDAARKFLERMRDPEQ